MSALDWVVLLGALATFVGYGVWRGRGQHDLKGYLLAGRSMPGWAVALSVMATQASAITFLSTPGQGYADGLRFVQFYFGLPLAMIVLCVTVVPIFHRLGVYTAYEYLESRFDGKTRSLAAGLFLVQRGLAAGLTIYAPSLVLSVVLGWDVRLTCALIGALVVIYTATGGSRAVGHTQVLQFGIILGTMAVAFLMVVRSLPEGVGFSDALAVAGRLGKLHAIETKFDPNDRYNLWSGLIGGFFLQLAYFGTDQSQVGRYLTGQSVAESRKGLIANGVLKIPMQFLILLLGVTVFVFHLFVPAPVFFQPRESAKLASGPHAEEYAGIASRHAVAWAQRRDGATALVQALRADDGAAAGAATEVVRGAQARMSEARTEVVSLLKRSDPGAQTNDTNYVFLEFVLKFLPAGLVGLVLAALFAASMNSTSAELSALTSTTVVDVLRRLPGHVSDERRDVWTSRVVTVVWAAFAVGFAQWASGLGTLVEAVNILGSLFYGTILGIFLCAFYLKRVGGHAVFAGAIVAEAVVVACFTSTKISFLWYNLIGCALVMIVATALSAVWPRRERVDATAA
ncbi:MAG: sodium:solute symporter [Candidatus Eisenbacteria bacterium]|uniref:Sodium:solute symporter n=1 Tax=Eiseniibacteriota bacterium TaxID=2212470 RepID=A0A933SGW1_UNCEI|nr:sodium:solute symporter [Candidatus Eisenbacteria bacterium]